MCICYCRLLNRLSLASENPKFTFETITFTFSITVTRAWLKMNALALVAETRTHNPEKPKQVPRVRRHSIPAAMTVKYPE